MNRRFRLSCQIPAAVLGVETPVQKKYVLSGIAFRASMTNGGKRAENRCPCFRGVKEKLIVLNSVAAERRGIAETQPAVAKKQHKCG